MGYEDVNWIEMMVMNLRVLILNLIKNLYHGATVTQPATWIPS
jgi:hypothetical protein